MDKKPEIIPLLPFHAGAIRHNGNDKAAESKAASDSPFQMDKYQVVRKEFLPQSRALSLNFSEMRFYVSASCLRSFPNVTAVLVMIDPDERLLILMPCEENTPDAFIWKGFSKGKPFPRRGASPVLFGMIFDLMHWDMSARYRILGRIVQGNENSLLVFDLKQAEVFQRIQKDESSAKISRKPQYPEDWRDRFGLNYGEHSRLVNVRQLGDFSILSALHVENSHKGKEPECGEIAKGSDTAK